MCSRPSAADIESINEQWNPDLEQPAAGDPHPQDCVIDGRLRRQSPVGTLCTEHGWHRSIQPSTDLKRGAQLPRCCWLVNVEKSRRPGDKDASCEENSVAGAGRFVGDRPYNWCRHETKWLVLAQHGKAQRECAFRHLLAAWGVAGRYEVPPHMVGRVALKDTELHACSQVCMLQKRQAIPIAIREQAGQVNLPALEHVAVRGVTAASHDQRELACGRRPPQDRAGFAVSLDSRGTEP